MVERAVAQVLENVLIAVELRARYPIDAFAAHLDQAAGVAIHPARHEVAADAGECLRALGQLRRRVVRAAGAEVGHPRRSVDVDDGPTALLHLFGTSDQPQPGELIVEARCDDLGELQRRELADPRHQPVAVEVLLADHALRFSSRVVVEVFLELRFDDAALLFDDEYFTLVLHEFQRALRFERPDHADLVDVESDAPRFRLVDAEDAQGLDQIEMALAGRHDAVARIGYVEDCAVDRIRGSERERCCLLRFQPLFDLRAREIRPAVVQPGRRRREVRGVELRVRRQLERHRRFHRFRDGFESDPHARVPRQGDPPQAELEILGDIRRIEPRHHECQEGHVGLMRHRRGDAAVVVAGDDEHAAVRRTAVCIAVLQRVACAIDAGPFAVPDAEYAIDVTVRIGLDLLRAEHRRRGEVFVHGRQEFDFALVEEALRAPDLLVQPAERRSAVAADETGGIESGGLVQRPLHQRNADERLSARQEYATGLAAIAIVEFVVVERVARTRVVGCCCHWVRSNPAKY